MALATYDGEPNSASSQFFIFLAEPELTPAGLNLLDGNFATFGYVTKGVDDLRSITLEDKVVSAKLISGSENLVR
ncbi:MAG: peptidylprolyl isomerase [Cyanobacteria bacterium J06597_1]